MVFVISSTGMKLMPTHESHARRLLKQKKAEIQQYQPFTIRLVSRDTGDTQPVEYKSDTGYIHVGIVIATEKRELVHEQRDLLSDETEKYNDCRKYRRTRRNRLRYRKQRFDNRKKPEGWLAPSVQNRVDTQLRLFEMYYKVCPITDATLEIGKFNIQVLKANEEGRPVPVGTDYQHGERYGSETLRQAVFARDRYTCQCCGRSIKDAAILHTHHVGYWKGDRTNRMANLMTVCEKCHTATNHKENGRLYGIEPKFKTLKDASFMNIARYEMADTFRKKFPNVNLTLTYGAMTKMKRQELGIEKSHANDAFAMGSFHPKRRVRFRCYKKVRRNNRILEKFYDAKYIDIRTGKKVGGKDLGCNRTKRNIRRNNPENLRIYHGKKVSKGERRIRRQRYSTQSGDILMTPYGIRENKGILSCGASILLYNKANSPTGKAITVNTKKVKVLKHVNGWKETAGTAC